MAELGELIIRAKSLAQDHAEHAQSDDWEEAVREALAVYNRDFPRRVVTDRNGDGNKFDFELGSDFDQSYSTVLEVEYPAGKRYPEMLEPRHWMLYQSPDGPVLRMLSYTPGSSEQVRVTFSSPHTIDGLNDAISTTIPGSHIDGVIALTASQVLRRLANRFLHEQDRSILHGDQVDRLSKSDEAKKRAGELDGMYRRIVGLGKKLAAAGADVNWDSSIAGSGMDHLTHPRKWR